MRSGPDDIRRAMREVSEELGRVFDQAGRLVRQAAQDAGFGSSSSSEARSQTTHTHTRSGGSPRRGGDGSSPLALIRELGELRDAGFITDEEFQAKKAELLRQL